MHSEITIRHATDNDVTAVRHLAALDESDAPQGDALLAFVDGELVAARAVADSVAVADPFRRTRHVLELLDLQRRQERAA
jgi:hypothetical protein